MGREILYREARVGKKEVGKEDRGGAASALTWE